MVVRLRHRVHIHIHVPVPGTCIIHDVYHMHPNSGDRGRGLGLGRTGWWMWTQHFIEGIHAHRTSGIRHPTSAKNTIQVQDSILVFCTYKTIERKAMFGV